MPEFCTCGAQLPPDALFCHKCGKPQRDIVVPENQAPPVVVMPSPVEPLPSQPSQPSQLAETTPVSFHNPAAVRVAVLVASVATLLGAILPFVNWIAGGFVAVVMYRRRTGLFLDVRKGVRMGWLTGVLMSVFGALVLSLSILPSVLNGKLPSVIEEQMKNVPWVNQEMIHQAAALLQTGAGVAVYIVSQISVLFVLVTCLSMAGGALGAKLTGQPSPPRGGNIV
jgi:hypothetical protein